MWSSIAYSTETMASCHPPTSRYFVLFSLLPLFAGIRPVCGRKNQSSFLPFPSTSMTSSLLFHSFFRRTSRDTHRSPVVPGIVFDRHYLSPNKKVEKNKNFAPYESSFVAPFAGLAQKALRERRSRLF
jgi:hypothetical protein